MPTIERLSQVRAGLRSIWSGVPTGLSLDPAERAAFDADRARALIRDTTIFVPLSALVNLLFWTTDSTLFAAAPEAIGPLAALRGVMTGYAVVAVVAVRLAPSAARGIAAVGSMIALGTFAAAFGAIGGPSTAWFHFIYPFVLVMIGWFSWPPQRFALTVGMGVSILLGYFGLHPEHLSDPLAGPAMAHLGYVVGMALVMGLFQDRRQLRYFLARRAVEHERAGLAARVAEQTADLRRLARRLDEVAESERAHIARELHDELGQTLTATRLVLALATRRFEREPASIGPNLHQAHDLVDQLSTQARRLVRDLRPPVLDHLGLGASVEWLAARFTSQGGPACSVAIPPEELQLEPTAATTAFRCVQEALTNVARHASATCVEVRVSVVSDQLVVEVRDDGVGLPDQSTDGVGLLGMRERAAALGGTVHITSARGAGTLVALQLPMGST